MLKAMMASNEPASYFSSNIVVRVYLIFLILRADALFFAISIIWLDMSIA